MWKLIVILHASMRPLAEPFLLLSPSRLPPVVDIARHALSQCHIHLLESLWSRATLSFVPCDNEGYRRAGSGSSLTITNEQAFWERLALKCCYPLLQLVVRGAAIQVVTHC